jgi:hypothetical protein
MDKVPQKPPAASGRKRKRLRIALLLCAVLLLTAVGLGGCISTITPPEHPSDPCLVYLLKDAKHTGLVLPDRAGGYVEFGYGEWDWYALVKDRWYHVFDTVLWPTCGCLGRRGMSADEISRSVSRGMLEAITVSRRCARALFEELDERFNSNKETMIFNPLYGMHFVRDDRGFWFLHNCHDAVAEWMEKVECDVSWLPIRLGLKIRKP